MVDPLPICTPGTPVPVQLAIVTGVFGVIVALITFLQSVIMERIRKTQTKRSASLMPGRIADELENRLLDVGVVPRITPRAERMTPRDPPHGQPKLPKE